VLFRSGPAPPVAEPPPPPPAPPAEAPPGTDAPAAAVAPPHPAARDRGKHHKAPEHAAPRAEPAPSSEPQAATAVRVPAPGASISGGPPTEPTAPPARGPREVLGEGEKLLGQGEVQDACVHGEEAKHMNPKLPAVYKFLGKCYMRAGRAAQANDNYKKYLELAPAASDAPFIKSMLK
jgi:hypothetical protein